MEKPLRKDHRLSPKAQKWTYRGSRRKYIVLISIVSIILVLAIALGVGLGVGLGLKTSDQVDLHVSSSSSSSSPSNSSAPAQNITNIWKPTLGIRWQIELRQALSNDTVDVPVYNIDLFENAAETISHLHSRGRKVICYFSAGSFEDFRPDAGQFDRATDVGHALDGWPGEWWVNTRSANVRKILGARLDMAVKKGCDGVDPDNIDAYGNENGLGLQQSDAVDFVKFLADAAHARDLSVGLKNGGAIVGQVVGKLQWVVQEQCVQYQECDQYQPFIEQGKPVFNIEYPDDAPDVKQSDVEEKCGKNKGFSSVLKKMELDDWLIECPQV